MRLLFSVCRIKKWFHVNLLTRWFSSKRVLMTRVWIWNWWNLSLFVMKELYRHILIGLILAFLCFRLFSKKLLHNLHPIKSIYVVLYMLFLLFKFRSTWKFKIFECLKEDFFSHPPFTWNSLSFSQLKCSLNM